jgi:hypothetical protein
MVVLLDEIAGRLADVAERLDRAHAEGIVWSRTETATTAWGGGYGGWRVVTVYNDGSADIYLVTNREERSGTPWLEGHAPLKSGESVRLTSEKGKERNLWHITQSGTATVRMFFNT